MSSLSQFIKTLTPNSVTFNNGGTGGVSGSTFDGGSALTISYNSVGAPSTTGTNATGTWGINITGSAASVSWSGVSGTPTTLSGYGITDAVNLTANNAFTGANTFTNATGQIFRQASTQDGILLRGRAGGTGSFTVEIIPATLTANRTLTAPNVSGTIVTTGDTGSITSTMIANATIVDGDISASAAIADTKLATISTAGKVSGTAITSGNISTSGSINTSSTCSVGSTSPPTLTTQYLNGNFVQASKAVAATAVDCSSGNYFTKTISSNTSFSFTNVVASGGAYSFILEVTQTSGAITWPSSVKWPDDTAPVLTTGRTHLFMFVTDDAGARWRGASLINYVT